MRHPVFIDEKSAPLPIPSTEVTDDKGRKPFTLQQVRYEVIERPSGFVRAWAEGPAELAWSVKDIALMRAEKWAEESQVDMRFMEGQWVTYTHIMAGADDPTELPRVRK